MGNLFFLVDQQYTKSMAEIVIYFINYGDYTKRGSAGVGPEDGSCHQNMEDKQWSVW